ncbi:MAG: tRNA preQ1(34) S-adenosylmethionine ribosyltransferase-isomerase QueA [Acidobacteriota bacterium]
MNQFDINTYDFHLPTDRIAQHPVHPRDRSRLMVVDRSSGTISDQVFSDLGGLLSDRDVLVLNETRVIPARLLGVKQDTGAKVEVLLLRPESHGWACLVKPAKRLKPGAIIEFGGGQLYGRIVEEMPFAGGRLVEFYGFDDWDATLEQVGVMPLPPYIDRPAEEGDNTSYQTVYSRAAGSVAAPTAGLHFTAELLDTLQAAGVGIIKLVLHVGIGTFRPVEAQDIRDHHMHYEAYELGEEQAERLNQARADGKRIIAVGTTSVRTLESTYSSESGFNAGRGETNLFVYPGHDFKSIDALITNFHLPKSSLVMLVYAFGGIELMHRAYRQAIEKDYRFFSYGDAMLII